MSQRRARNIISRTAELGVRAADLVDEGRTDARVAAMLNAEFKRTGKDEISGHTVKSFRKDTSPGGYARVRADRQARQDAAADVRMILGAAKGAGADFAQAGLDEIAQELYQLIRKMRAQGNVDPKVIIGLSRELSRIVELQQADNAARRALDATRIKGAIEERKISGAELVAEVDRIMGIKA